ncbi:MAG: hypothetical protein HUJ68_05955 [Clostridia bacterium]|nr:hypothetical protein [Clostridia bacterium]
MKYTDPDGRVTEQQNKDRNIYQNGYAPPDKNSIDRMVAVGLFKKQGYTGTHNLTTAENTKEGRKAVGGRTGGDNVDYRGAVGTIFEGMQFIYNEKTGEIVTDEVNKGTFDYNSPYSHVPYFSHKGTDIDPWIEWGTGGADDASKVIMSEDMWNEVSNILSEFEAGNITKKEAQQRIQQTLPTPPEKPKVNSGVEL